MNKISLAYSPDTDDAFMVYALKDHKIDWRSYEFEFISGDIQELNAKALEGSYDITAISVAAYPHIQTEYDLLPIGASIGQNFGPAIVVKEDSQIKNVTDLENLKVALPGQHTSAFMAAMDVMPSLTSVHLPFDHIGPAILKGDVDAGVLIHELQLNCEDSGLRKIGNLGSLWHQKYELPLPLGAIAIRKSLGTEAIEELLSIYRESIQYAFENKDLVMSIASQWAKEGLDQSLTDRYLEMYVNEDSLELSPQVRDGMSQLYACGHAHGISPAVDLTQAIRG